MPLCSVRRLVSLLVSLVLLAGLLVACSGGSQFDEDSPGCLTSLSTGSYARSCEDCTMTGSFLTCAKCGDGSGGNPRATIDTCSCPSAASSNAIANIHGVLMCGSASGAGSSSSSGSSSGCDGCHANSDCGSCERCELSTCTCRSKAVCN